MKQSVILILLLQISLAIQMPETLLNSLQTISDDVAFAQRQVIHAAESVSTYAKTATDFVKRIPSATLSADGTLIKTFLIEGIQLVSTQGSKLAQVLKQQKKAFSTSFSRGCKVDSGFSNGFVEQSKIINSVMVQGNSDIPGGILKINQVKGPQSITGQFLSNIKNACSDHQKLKCAQSIVQVAAKCGVAIASEAVNIVEDIQCLLSSHISNCLPCFCGVMSEYKVNMIGCDIF